MRSARGAARPTRPANWSGKSARSKRSTARGARDRRRGGEQPARPGHHDDQRTVSAAAGQACHRHRRLCDVRPHARRATGDGIGRPLCITTADADRHVYRGGSRRRILGVFITRGLLRALGTEPAALSDIARRIAAGDLGTGSSTGAAPAGSVLASMRDMQANLTRLIAEVRTASGNVATGAGEIASGRTSPPARNSKPPRCRRPPRAWSN